MRQNAQVPLAQLIRPQKALTQTYNITFKALCAYLNEADEAYIKAIQLRKVSPFIKYATATAIRRTRDYFDTKPEIQFGLEKYRSREWTLVNVTTTNITVLKYLHHMDVKMNKGVFVPLGDNLSELWTLSEVDGMLKVCEIRRQ